jgi:hypothetical protein
MKEEEKHKNENRKREIKKKKHRSARGRERIIWKTDKITETQSGAKK